MLKAVFLLEGFDGFAPLCMRPAGEFSAYHNIFRGMLKVDELYHVDVVAEVTENALAHGVGKQGAHALFYYALTHEDVQRPF